MLNWYMQYLALMFSLYEITVLHLNIQCIYQMNQNVVNKADTLFSHVTLLWLIRQIIFSDF